MGDSLSYPFILSWLGVTVNGLKDEYNLKFPSALYLTSTLYGRQ